jgi:hypothetical protein
VVLLQLSFAVILILCDSCWAEQEAAGLEQMQKLEQR